MHDDDPPFIPEARRSHDHVDHDHDDHDHHHHDGDVSHIEARVRALEEILTQKGYVDPAALDRLVETYERRIGPRNGAHVIARAWRDPDYCERLRTDATRAIAELGYSGRQGEHMIAVFNAPGIHNLVVCTLCSCYPWPVLGLPPVWYKSAPYRSRAVIDPRSVLAEFGFHPALDTQIRVWDSTAEIRYLVVPERPPATEGWSEDQLASLVTRNSMIGVSPALSPEAAS